MYLQKIIQELNRIRNIPNTITRMSELEKFNKTTYPDLLKKNKLQENVKTTKLFLQNKK